MVRCSSVPQSGLINNAMQTRNAMNRNQEARRAESTQAAAIKASSVLHPPLLLVNCMMACNLLAAVELWEEHQPSFTASK